MDEGTEELSNMTKLKPKTQDSGFFNTTLFFSLHKLSLKQRLMNRYFSGAWISIWNALWLHVGGVPELVNEPAQAPGL